MRGGRAARAGADAIPRGPATQEIQLGPLAAIGYLRTMEPEKRWGSWLIAGGLACVSACYHGLGAGGPGAGAGAEGDGGTAGSNGDSGDTASDDSPGGGTVTPGRVWRLTARQYERTIEAGLKVDIDLPEIAITARTEDFTNKAHENFVDDVFFAQIETGVEALVTENLGAVTAQLPCEMAGLDASCLRTFLEGFTLRVQRTDQADLDGYVALFEALRADATVEQALVGVVTAVLIAPKTLFRTEIGAPTEAGQAVRLTPFELAETLSYSVWDGPPDDELLARAVDGSLSERAVLEAQLDRMIDSEQGRRGMLEFLSQWLGLAGFDYIDKNATTYPDYPNLRASMRAETQAVLEDVLAGDDARLADLIGGSQTIVDAQLAEFYGIDFPPGAPTALVDLPPERRGVFTHPAVIAAMSEPTLTGLMYRSKVLLRRLLCVELVPPPNAEFPDPEEFPPDATTRDKLESLAVTQPCAGCHVTLNPVAFAMENFDAIGGYRELESGSPIDASGSVKLEDETITFANAPEFFAKVANHPAVEECFASHAFRYTWGRELLIEDHEVVAAAVKAFQEHTDMRELFREAVISLALQDRRGEGEDDACISP